MTKEMLEAHRAKILWCVHILGPDEMIPKESYAAAEEHANKLRDFMYGPTIGDLDVMCREVLEEVVTNGFPGPGRHRTGALGRLRKKGLVAFEGHWELTDAGKKLRAESSPRAGDSGGSNG